MVLRSVVPHIPVTVADSCSFCFVFFVALIFSCACQASLNLLGATNFAYVDKRFCASLHSAGSSDSRRLCPGLIQLHPPEATARTAGVLQDSN